jgi:hypothetical protein
MRLSALLVKSSLITSSDVSTHLQPNWKADWIFAETPLSAISRFNWSPESPEARQLLKAARQDGSSFRADLEQSTSEWKAVYEIR